ncbi:tripartite tricarboxylate transporter TctB family protein [Candidatus Epulonipiscium viviparus]|uniref:tripartite tricarboxylate transporter TctB family protein n=1 Tax=Candidatus Epulonipiscium viviparus TaxID=420336 RepID=UPI00016C0F28|nr:tripartite tricarboxylate transporter TctB family protein [Candidatus Epulopiscium viviparus]
MGEIIFNIILIILSIGMYVATYRFPVSIIDKSGGAALFPRIVIIGLIVLLIIRTVIILKSQAEKDKQFIFLEIFVGRRLAFYLLFIAYALTITTLGFFISSSIFLAIAIPFLYKLQHGNFMNKKQIITTIVTSTISVYVLYFIFTNYFNVMLPSGIFNI